MGRSLFISFMNDKDENINSNMDIFADDTNIEEGIKTSDKHIQIASTLNTDFKTLTNWSLKQHFF